MDTFALFTAKAWGKNGVETIEYAGEICTKKKNNLKKT